MERLRLWFIEAAGIGHANERDIPAQSRTRPGRLEVLRRFRGMSRVTYVIEQKHCNSTSVLFRLYPLQDDSSPGTNRRSIASARLYGEVANIRK